MLVVAGFLLSVHVCMRVCMLGVCVCEYFVCECVYVRCMCV